jgi:putative pyrroloquinoline-quinone binding quinoprotein
MRRRLPGMAALLLIILPSTAMGTVRFVKWDKPHGGSRANLAALDLSTRKVLWEAHPGKSINFVAETKDGVLVGTDEGSLVLLNASDGKVLWKSFLEKGEINRFHSESEEGFLISSGDERFWLVDHAGKVVMRCGDQCLAK